MSDSIEPNPLSHLDEADEVPFDRIGAEHVEPALRDGLYQARRALDALAADKHPPTWSNVFESLESATEKLAMMSSVVSHLESVRTTPEFREAYNRMKPELSAFFAAIPLDPDLYARLTDLAASDEGKGLPSDRARALETTLDDFRRNGAELGPDGKGRLERIARELATATSTFGQRVLDATAAWSEHVSDASKLAGLPPTALAGMKAAAEAKGLEGWLLTLHAPSLVPALTYLDDRALREKIYRAYHARASGPEGNGPTIKTILRLRREQAQLLGYVGFGNLVLEPRMAKDPAAARKFVQDLGERVKDAFDRETTELEAFRQERAGEGAGALEPWDVAYYAEKLRRERYDFDEEALRPYFSRDRVMKGLFQIAERLFGIQIAERPDLPVWHSTVQGFEIRESGAVTAHFYTDLEPREEKRGGAWMHGLRSGVLREGGLDRPHLGLLAGNLSPSVDGKPALLTHDEVQTIFHEFGHLLHHTLSKVNLRSQAGTRVAWDFVELPSQILENWCWNREALDVFARHHETDEPIPEPLFAAMSAARRFRAASATMRQLGFAEVDLALHMDFDPSGEADPVQFARTVLERYSPAAYYDGWGFLNGFTHLFGSAVGYAAGYYSYKWAEVLDADAFSRFEAEGVLNPTVGAAFRDAVLARGDSEAPEKLFEAFMGRGPRIEALLERSGLSAA